MQVTSITAVYHPSTRCVLGGNTGNSGKESSLSQDLRHHVKRHLNIDLYFLLLPIILFYQTQLHEHAMWSFRIADIVLPLNFKSHLCSVHTDTKHYKCLINMPSNTCHTPLSATFRARRHSLVICQRKGTLKENLPLFHCTRSDSSPHAVIERWTVIPVRSQSHYTKAP